jgi:hypothetical protein
LNAVIRQFLATGDQAHARHVHIISKLERAFFVENLVGISEQAYTCHVRCLDAGALQSSPLAVDVPSTLDFYIRDIFPVHNELVVAEAYFLTAAGVDFVLSDATPLACTAAKAAGIRSAVVSNFTWDFVYREMVSLLALNSEGFEAGYYIPAVDQCNKDYLNADMYIQLPCATPAPEGFDRSRIIDGPLVCRQSCLSKAEVFDKYEILFPIDQPLAVLSFGGHSSENFPLTDNLLPEGWNCLVLGAGWNRVSDRFQMLPRETYVPDIFNAADVVIGKVGT